MILAVMNAILPTIIAIIHGAGGEQYLAYHPPEPANQCAPKALFTCVVYINNNYSSPLDFLRLLLVYVDPGTQWCSSAERHYQPIVPVIGNNLNE